MEIYQIEQLIVERNDLLNDLQKYVENEALHQQAHEIEESVFRKLLCIGKGFLKEVFIRFGTGKSDMAIANKDDETVPYHKTTSRRYQSIFGKIEISHACYWKRGSKGFFPLDAHFNLPERCYSHLLVKWVQDWVAEGPYEEGLQRIEDIFGLKLCKRGQEVLSQEVVADVGKFYQQPRAKQNSEGSVIVATSDCKGVVMVPRERSELTQSKAKQGTKVRDGRGRKGLKRDAVVTADYSINPEVRTPQEMCELLMRSHSKDQIKEKKIKGLQEGFKPREPINKTIMASLEGKTSAFVDLADRIAQRDPASLKKIFIQVDGAKSLEKGLLQEFEKRGWSNRIVGIALDIIHVMEYVWELSTALHGEKGEERVSWVRKQALAILEGKVGYVIGGLKQMLTKRENLRNSKKKALEKVITYFENHKHMMKYNEYLANGLPRDIVKCCVSKKAYTLSPLLIINQIFLEFQLPLHF